MRLSNHWSVLILIVGLAFGAGSLGCASDDGGGGAAPANAESAEPAEPKPVKGAKPPADHRMAKLALKMASNEVMDIMGAPDNEKRYVSGKAFNPFNYGNDSGHRMEWAYGGEGRVVFALPRWGGAMRVVRIDYDPNEDGN